MDSDSQPMLTTSGYSKAGVGSNPHGRDPAAEPEPELTGPGRVGLGRAGAGAIAVDDLMLEISNSARSILRRGDRQSFFAKKNPLVRHCCVHVQ